MHRSRSSLLVIFAAVAACSTRDDSDANEILSQDSTLVASFEVKAPQLPLPDACGTNAVVAQPAAANRSRAAALTRQAYEAELVGNVEEARSLLRRASELDGTDKSAAYHLGRTSEALGDHSAAMTAYCRFLTLAPTTAESVEARQRVAALAQREIRMAAGSVSPNTPTGRRAPAATARRVTRERATVRARVASTPVEQSGRARTSGRGTHSASAAVGGADSSPVPSDPMTPATDVVATSRRGSTVDQASTASRTASRGPSRAQGAGIGAVAGAMIGAATGRSVKSAVIGAAAGGILGTLVVGRGIRRY